MVSLSSSILVLFVLVSGLTQSVVGQYTVGLASLAASGGANPVSSCSPYSIGAVFTVDGNNSPALSGLTTCTAYTFTISGIGASHHFAITATSSNTGASTAGDTASPVTNSGTYTWTPQTAGTYGYICTAHTCMGNLITVTGADCPSSSSTAAAAASSSSTAAAAGGSSSSSGTTTTSSSSTGAAAGGSSTGGSASNTTTSSTGGASSTGSSGPDYVITVSTTLGSPSGCTSSTGSAFQVNGVAQPTITFALGETKTFQGSGITGHEFAITSDTSNIGGSSSGVIAGKTITGSGTFSWTPTTAGTYHYICDFAGHTCMGNTITVTGGTPTSSSSTGSGSSASHLEVGFGVIVALGLSVLALLIRQQ